MNKSDIKMLPNPSQVPPGLTDDQRFGRDKSHVTSPEEFFQAWVGFGERYNVKIEGVARDALVELGNLDPGQLDAMETVLQWERDGWYGDNNADLANRMAGLIEKRIWASAEKNEENENGK